MSGRGSHAPGDRVLDPLRSISLERKSRAGDRSRSNGFWDRADVKGLERLFLARALGDQDEVGAVER